MKSSIFSIVLIPIPGTNNKSSIEEKEPISNRLAIIFSAVTGPIPGSEINSSLPAIFKFIFSDNALSDFTISATSSLI